MGRKMDKKTSLFLGIDPGMSGGFAVVNELGEFVDSFPTPIVGKNLNIPSILLWLHAYHDPQYSDYKIASAVLEQVGARPGQGVSSMFKFGRVYGIVEGLIAALEIPYTLVTPQAWTKVMHIGVESRASLDPKERSNVAVSRLFPKANLHLTPRSKKPHDGVVDAILMAEYARRTFNDY